MDDATEQALTILLWVLVGILILIALLFGVKIWYQKISSKSCKSKRKMDGKTVIVTGANTGIGKETARDLARRGARVILACRDLARGNEAKNDIIESTGNTQVEMIRLDLGSISSVREFVREFLQREDRLDVLVNNAAAMSLPNVKSKDGLQQEMQVNHFGPFLLTVLLIGIMKMTPQSRVVVVSSKGHVIGKVELDNLQCEKGHPGSMQLYCNAKLANILFSNELARRLEGTGVTCNSLHPGVVKTDISRNYSKVMKTVMGTIAGFFIKDAKQGAQTSIHCAVSEELDGVTGKYFQDCRETKTSSTAQNRDLAKKLWDECAKLTKLTPEELREVGG